MSNVVFVIIENMGYEGESLRGIYSSAEKANSALDQLMSESYTKSLSEWTRSVDNNHVTYFRDAYTSYYVTEEEVQ